MTSVINWLHGLKAQSRDQWLLTIIASLGFLYLLPKVMSIQDAPLQASHGFVLRIIWLAGKLWSAGQNPYGPLFLKEYLASGPGPDALWYYPPYWYPIAVPLSYLPLPVADGLWKAINFLLLIAATHLIARALADISKQTYAIIFAGGLGFVFFMQAVASTLYNSQTSIIVYFGFAGLIFGLLKRRVDFVVVGLVFLALKPQIGVVAFAAVATLPRYRWAIVLAGGVCILATIPILFTGDYLAAVEGFLVNDLTGYAGQPQNDPNNRIGLTHILAYLFSIRINSLVLIFGSSAVAFAIFYFSSLNNSLKSESTSREVKVLGLFVAVMLFALPVHGYDIVVVALLFMILLAMPIAGKWLVALGLALCIRAGNLSSALGFTNPASQQFPESLLISVALCFILLGALWSVFVDLRHRENDEPAQHVKNPIV